MRHAEWNRRMTEEMGSFYSAVIGYSYELRNLYDQWQKGEDFKWNEMWMDLHNNREGRSGRNACDLLNEGRLRTIDPPYGGKGGLY